MSGYIINNGKIDINLNAYDYFDTTLMNMIFGFTTHATSDLSGNPLPSSPKSVHNLANIANGDSTIGSLIPFLKNSAITTELLEKAKFECEDAMLEIVQNGDIENFSVNIERQNYQLIFTFTLYIAENTLFYRYVYNSTTGALAKVEMS